MDRSEIIVYNEKIMSQIKPNQVTDFWYETRVGFSFTVCEGHITGPITWFLWRPLPLTPKAEQRAGDTFLFLTHQWEIPHQR